MADPLLIAKGGTDVTILPEMINRHGLIAGATGTGKTVTLRVIVESLSRIGVPVFLADIKGDLSGIAMEGGGNPKIDERIKKLGLTGFSYAGYPVIFRDLFGENGHPVRTTISELGPLLLGRILDLNETQAGVLSIIFRVADDNGLLLLDLKDLRAMVTYVSDHAAEIKGTYGNVSTSSTGAIQRALLALEDQGADQFFGEPALEIDDLIRTADGKGVINLFAAEKLMQSPKLYSTFLLWLLSELYEQLPEEGDLEKPKFVFFFDEAHLLFKDAPKALEEKIVQIVRLIRSKGVGIYFITQSPSDIPEDVLGQLGNKVQHALRATTPNEEKAVRTAARSFRQNPAFETEKAISELGIGEALVSILDKQGSPTPVERAFIVPPTSRLSPLSPEERKKIMAASPDAGKYDTPVDRESAYEKLAARTEAVCGGPAVTQRKNSSEKSKKEPVRKTTPRSRKEDQPAEIVGDIAVSVARSIGTQVGRELVRGLLGSLGGTKRR
ncbi:helicase HerA-like domain-containing protein [uncultured Methanospirillum sp.]|uniref:helicase HerA-like domain-containing protein n=1 Tax=uncultured Methanospirillum sp. TaxID=262503 RepID=UPI0029C7EC1E|nr:helicase HerA-like domain-containing protein [uncultured Methanospirillum sp.]